MPQLSSAIIKEKIPIKNLKLVLEKDDILLDCIKQGMIENNVTKCDVASVSGKINGLITCMDGHKFKSIELKEQELLKASGHFKYGYGELYGKLNVSTAGRKPFCGTLVKGTALEGFEINLTFIQ